MYENKINEIIFKSNKTIMTNDDVLNNKIMICKKCFDIENTYVDNYIEENIERENDYYDITDPIKFDNYLTCNRAVINNHYDCLLYACKLGCKINSDMIDMAAENGNLKMLKFFIKCKLYIYSSAMNSVIKSGNIECFKFLAKNYHSSKLDRLDLFKDCLRYNKLELAKYLYDNEIDRGDKWSMYKFISDNNCHVDCLKFIYDRKYEWNNNDYITYGENGNYEHIKFLIENNFNLNSEIYFYIIKYGHVDCLKSLYESNFKMNENDGYNILYNCNYVFHYELDKDYNWDIKTLYYVMKNKVYPYNIILKDIYNKVLDKNKINMSMYMFKMNNEYKNICNYDIYERIIYFILN